MLPAEVLVSGPFLIFELEPLTSATNEPGSCRFVGPLALAAGKGTESLPSLVA